MKKIYVRIEGISCDHCRQKITSNLLELNNVKNITFHGNIAEVQYERVIDKNKVINKIIQIDYYTDLEMISDNIKKIKKNITFIELIIITLILLLIVIMVNNIFGFNIFNMIPTVNSNVTYLMLFVTGLLTSIHCISMCGAINLMASYSYKKNFKKPILYNLGRMISYTLLGGIVGLIGSIFQLNTYIQGIVIILASVIMLLMSLNMMGFLNFKIKEKVNFITLKNNSSFIIGLLNGFIPCGPLQAMQLYALSTGSFVYGALSMFLFCLGTIPLILFVGMLSNLLKKKHQRTLSKISIVLILILSIVMLNRGLLGIGIDISNAFKPNYDNYLKAEIKDDYQYVEFDLTYKGYQDIIVQEGIPVKMIIKAKEGALTGCNNAIKINAFNIQSDLTIGENEIIFIPNKIGSFTYTCWMNMLKNKIVVVKDIKLYK